MTRSVRYNTIKYDELANMVASDSPDFVIAYPRNILQRVWQ